MALIWAEGFVGEKALAPAWRDMVLAKAQADASDPNNAQAFAAAYQNAKATKNKYDALVADANKVLETLGRQGQGRTHVLIVGVGKYDSKDIQAVTTSVLGARKFAEWALTEFRKADRPLGSVELLNSPKDGDAWTPLPAAAAALGLAADAATLPDETATFQNIEQAFNRLLARAGTCADNALIWYFAGHGVSKSESLLLPQDAQLPGNKQQVQNLIAPYTTMTYLQSQQPGVQCFFIDACSETNLGLIYNVMEQPGRPLCTPVNGAAIPGRDAMIFFGSYLGRKAYGPENDAPYFTQELINCLNRRARDTRYGASQVSLTSLSTALKAAGEYRAELEKNTNIQFTEAKPGVSSGYGQLCELKGPVEVLVQVRCLPPEAMSSAKLYVVDANGTRVNRAEPGPKLWCTPILKGQSTASAEFDPPAFQSKPYCFEPVPPVMEVLLRAIAGD